MDVVKVPEVISTYTDYESLYNECKNSSTTEIQKLQNEISELKSYKDTTLSIPCIILYTVIVLLAIIGLVSIIKSLFKKRG